MFFLTDTATCGIYTLSLHDAFRSGSADDDRRIEEVGGGVGEIWTRRDVLARSEEHTSELQSRFELVCRLRLEKKNTGVAGGDVLPSLCRLCRLFGQHPVRSPRPGL